MGKSDDLVKYIGKEVATYIKTPKEERVSKKNAASDKNNEPWTTRWFGMLPMALGLWVKPRNNQE
jgi:YqzE-like protein